MDKDEFKKDLEEIVRLFKLLKAKAEKMNYIDMDSDQYKQLELFVKSYDMFKGNINEEMLKQFGAPIHDMLKELIRQLKEDLGEEYLYQNLQEEPEKSIEEKKKVEVLPTLEEIDRLLQNPKLSAKEIDNLLDLRRKIKENQS
ncbi:MAG: hypothetical protein Kow0068_07500 [Marinilabiliales bacterium]